MTPRRERAVAVLATMCGVAAAGVGGYALGAASGEDLDLARAKGAAAGAVVGGARGTSAGREDGRRAGFAVAYEPAMRVATRRAYGLS